MTGDEWSGPRPDADWRTDLDDRAPCTTNPGKDS